MFVRHGHFLINSPCQWPHRHRPTLIAFPALIHVARPTLIVLLALILSPTLMACYAHRAETCEEKSRPICKKCWPMMDLDETQDVKLEYNHDQVLKGEQPLCVLLGCWNVVRQEGAARDVGECHTCYTESRLKPKQESMIPAAKRRRDVSEAMTFGASSSASGRYAHANSPRPDLLRSSAMSPRHAISPRHQQLIDVVARTARSLKDIASSLEVAAAAYHRE